MPSFETDILADRIHAKHACLVQLRDMGRLQLALIDEGNMTALLDVLATKQRVLLKLQQIERDLDRFRGQNPDDRRWRTPQDRQRSAEELQDCERILGDIVSQEKCSEVALTRRRDEAAIQLRTAHLASHARGAYADQQHDQPGELDLLSDHS